MPLRGSLKRKSVDLSIEEFGLKFGPVTVGVVGGSQGARNLNAMVAKALPMLVKHEVQFIHLTGADDNRELEEAYRAAEIPAAVRKYCHEMEAFYSSCKLIVSRAGASTLAEISFYRVASILVPYPYAADDHQMRNAEAYARSGASIVVPESAGPEELGRTIAMLLKSPEKRVSMGDDAGFWASDLAAKRIVEIVEHVLAL
jgi:UDP-N-acetylglucosamine--N-acetylmuramyl-(pentapeptide) pyrophosphoryl-undecaprenol N-acetylglucosamine transferase